MTCIKPIIIYYACFYLQILKVFLFLFYSTIMFFNENSKVRNDDSSQVLEHGVVQPMTTVSPERFYTSRPANVFSDPEIAAHYTAVYEKAKYECRHVFDPDLEWTRKEEKRVVRKLDWHGKIKSSSTLLEPFIGF